MKEIENWKVHKTFQKVANEGQSTTSVKWVVSTKNKTKGNIYKRDSLHAVLKKLNRITLGKIYQHVAKTILEWFYRLLFLLSGKFIH